jgi:hypothetical protein
MATYAQRKADVRKALRRVKSMLNLSNGLLEKTRREADRLLDRKTIITPDSLQTLEKNWETTVISSNAVTSSLTQLFVIARQYL